MESDVVLDWRLAVKPTSRSLHLTAYRKGVRVNLSLTLDDDWGWEWKWCAWPVYTLAPSRSHRGQSTIFHDAILGAEAAYRAIRDDMEG